ncbi:MAG: hypothetical protein JXA37_03210, partial [Chloroflexia bacterium]|nr:hypothetical protein [Chloroflexia bacterium]
MDMTQPPSPPPRTAYSTRITLHDRAIGSSPPYIGATEAAGFWIEDLDDLGVNTYRLWTKMAELEWWDDDDAMDGQWDDSEYGTPDIATIQADAGSGFSNTIPWAWWDARFDEVQSWRYGLQTRREIIQALVQNGIQPIMTLRTYDDQGQPEQRPAAGWAPRPPVDQAFLNEWWEHCFALAYWLNVRNDYGVTHFEVLNEPDYPGQGWQEYGGTVTDYVSLTLAAHDAIHYANSFAGLPVYMHAPVVANYGSAYVAGVLDGADQAVQVVDYHDYADNVRPGILSLRSTIARHNPDGIREPIWNSEWGALWSSYHTLQRAMTTADQLLTFAEEGVQGLTIFNMYDWSTTPGQNYGLIDLQDDGMGGALRVPSETYYAYRLLVRGLRGAKSRLELSACSTSTAMRMMATRDRDNVYLIVVRDAGLAPENVLVDLSELGLNSGQAYLYEYSAAYKDELVAILPISAGLLTFTAPAR